MTRSTTSLSKGATATLYTIFLCISFFLSSSASAAPFQPSEGDGSIGYIPALIPDIWKRYEGTPRPENGKKNAKNAVDWPDDEETKKHMNTQKTHIFYSNIGDGKQAEIFAARDDINGVTLFMSLPPDWFKLKTDMDPKTRKRSMFNNHIDRASGVFSDTASGTIFFVGDPDNDPLEDSVWRRIEFKSLVANKMVDKITWVNFNDFSDRKQLWPPEDGVAWAALAELLSSNGPPVFNDYLGYGPPPGIAEPGEWQAYQPGWCGLHFVQYQKNQGPGDKTRYRFDVRIKDSLGQTIGWKTTMPVTGSGFDGVNSALPLVLLVGAGAVDSDPVEFRYSDQAWNTGKANGRHACKVGAYDNGARQGDCGFTC